MKLLIEILAHESHVNGVHFNQEGTEFLSLGMDNVVKVWRVGDWEQVGEFAGHDKSVNALSFTPDGTKFYTASSDDSVKLWDYASCEILEDYPKMGKNLLLSQDGKTLSVGYRKKVQVYDVPSMQKRFVVDAHGKQTHAYVFSPDSTKLVTGGMDPLIHIWDVESGEKVNTLEGNTELVMKIVYAPGGNFITSIAYDGKLLRWDKGNPEPRLLHQLPKGGYPHQTISPDGRKIALSHDHKITLVDADSGEMLNEMKLKPKGVYGMQFSPDGKMLANAAADKRVRVFEL